MTRHPALTQTQAGPLGVASATARRLLVEGILHETLRNVDERSTGVNNDIVRSIWRAYDRMPAAARGPATTAAFAWAKAYVSSPEFAAAYATQREGQRPAGAAGAASANVEAELQKMRDEQRAAAEAARKMAESLPEKDRAAMLAQLKAMEEQLNSPETLKTWRAALEAQLGAADADRDNAAARWNANYPADPRMFVRGHLERFLAVTENLDYSLPTIVLKAPTGDTMGFLSPGYTGIAWQRVYAIMAGKDAVDAGRAAAAAWLKEVGGT
jgi:hypothetical protein